MRLSRGKGRGVPADRLCTPHKGGTLSAMRRRETPRRRFRATHYLLLLALVASPSAQPVGARSPCALEYCFGAVGIGCCGIPGIRSADVWGCEGSRCVVNAGSWDHDECCWQHGRDGTMCGVLVGPACNAEWDRAVHRTLHRLSWMRVVDRTHRETDGRVDRSQLCAPSGTIVARGDEGKCCARRGRALDPVAEAERVKRQGVVLDHTFEAVVCGQ